MLWIPFSEKLVRNLSFMVCGGFVFLLDCFTVRLDSVPFPLSGNRVLVLANFSHARLPLSCLCVLPLLTTGVAFPSMLQLEKCPPWLQPLLSPLHLVFLALAAPECSSPEPVSASVHFQWTACPPGAGLI